MKKFRQSIVGKLPLLIKFYLIAFVMFSPTILLTEVVGASETGYDFTIQNFTLPASAEPSQALSIPLGVSNIDTNPWYTSYRPDEKIISLGYLINGVLDTQQTILTKDILGIDSAPNNITDPAQTLSIVAPAADGTYTFEIVLVDSDTREYFRASEPNRQIYTVTVQTPLESDVTAPTGSIVINEGAEETTETTLNIMLNAADPAIEGQEMTGVTEYIVSQNATFAEAVWQPFGGETMSHSETIPNAPNSYTFYTKFKDGAGNESEAYSDSIAFVSSVPTGTIEIDPGELLTVDGELQVQDNQLDIVLQANSNVAVTEYVLADNADFTGAIWQTFDTPNISQATSISREIPDESGTYTFFVIFKNEYGQESEIYRASVYYQSYNITPEIEAQSEDVLYGGEMRLSVLLKNTGGDIGYNAGLEINLPAGFSFKDATSCAEVEICSGSEIIQPTYTDGAVIRYDGIDDLLPGEETRVNLTIAVGGEAAGYKIGDQVEIPITARLFTRSNFKTGFETTQNHTVELRPFTVEFDGGTDEQLVEEEVDNKISIKTNPDIESAPGEEDPLDEDEAPCDTDCPNPLVIQFELENRADYIENSQTVVIDGVEISPTEYNIAFEYFEDLVTGNPILRWVFKNRVHVDTLVEVYFKSKINRVEDQTILGDDFVEHGQKIEQKISVSGRYANPGEEAKEYTEAETREIIAKYFTLEKSATPVKVGTNQGIRYTITIETSKAYDLSGIEIHDIIPDGVNFSEDAANLSYSEDLALTLFSNETNSDGSELLTWRINAPQGVTAGTVYEFSYEVVVDTNYEVKTDDESESAILSSDVLTSTVTVTGIWSDTEIAREEPLSERKISDTGAARNTTHPVSFDQGIKHTEDESYSQSVAVKIGDQLDVLAKIQFPETTPTKDFTYRLYLPIGTELVGDITLTPNIAELESIEGGYLLDFGDIEPATTVQISYSLQVQDDANLKEAVVVRNLFRADYYNIDSQKFTYRENVALNILEPRISVEKSKTSGYFARGEQASTQTIIENIGTDTAFEFTIVDTIPQNVTVDEETIQVHLDESALPFIYDSTDRTITIENISLSPNQKVTITYDLTTNSDVLFGDSVGSTVRISEYANRGSDETLPRRVYPATTHSFDWIAVEPLLFTYAPETQVGRDQEFTTVFQVEAVGKSPVYNTNVAIDLSEAGLFFEDIDTINFTVYAGETLIEPTVAIENGMYTFSEIDIDPNQIISFLFEGKSPRLGLFEETAETSIEAIGNDALGNAIRKDGSAEHSADTDTDDMDEGAIIIVQTDFEEPTGDITFIENEQEITFTSSLEIDSLAYEAWDSSEIVAVQFSIDGETWDSLATLDDLSTEVQKVLNIEGNWNAWDGELFSTDSEIVLEIEGENVRYMQVVDLDGNVGLIANSVVRDTTPPLFAEVVLSPFQHDFTNPEVTGTRTNFANFYVIENTLETDETAGVGEYSYCTDECASNSNWSEWNTIESENNGLAITYEASDLETTFEVHMKFRDLAGNESETIYSDTILYKPDVPTVTFTINEGAPYTSSPEELLKLRIDDSEAGVTAIRFQTEDCNEDAVCTMGEWETLDRTDADGEEWSTTLLHFLPTHWEDGEKEVCLQLQDPNGNKTTIVCETIVLDKIAPEGFILLDDGAFQTNGLHVDLFVDATDPILPDGSKGAHALEVRFSKTGENCDEKNTAELREACEENWDSWVAYDPDAQLGFDLEDIAGEQTLYAQFRDGVGNTSQVYSDQIIYNPYLSDGNIFINNDALFTNSKFVTLDLEVDMTGFVCGACTQPVLMRFIQLEPGETVPPPPYTPTSRSYQFYKLVTERSGKKPWTYWEEYPSNGLTFDPATFGAGYKQWDLDEGNVGKPNYGLKNVYVQYMLPNGEVTTVYSDSIVYAPYYGIEYLRDTTWNSENSEEKVFGLGKIPAELLSQDQVTVQFNAKNTGSFTWPQHEDTRNEATGPVHFSYTWTRVGGEDPIGIFGGEGDAAALDYYRGNSTLLPENISWDEETGQVALKVDTPDFPGEYRLTIDTIHEGEAWFSEYGNEAPTYAIEIVENPDKVTPTPGIDPETGEVLGNDDIEYGIGGNGGIPFPTDYPNCADSYGQNWYGTTCYIGGILQRNSDERYDYMIWGQETNNPEITHRFNFIPGNDLDHMLNQEVLARVFYRNNSHQFKIDWIDVAPKSWISEYRSNLNDPQFNALIPVSRGMNFEIQVNMFNGGTGIWKSNEHFLVATGNTKFSDGGGEQPSIFYDAGTWVAKSRVQLDNNPSGYGSNSIAPFTFNIQIPDTIAIGQHRQCFVQTNHPYRDWQRRDSFCITFDVQMGYEEEREYVCSVPQAVYEEKDTNSNIIGYVNQNDVFVVTVDNGEWIKGYLPSGGGEGWIERPDGEIADNYDCFDNVVTIENPIPEPEFDIVPTPTGDTGIVINLGDIPVKDGPADTFNTITEITYGTQVQVLAETHGSDRFGGWLYVRVDKSLCEDIELTDGQCEGWIPKGTLWHANDPKDVEFAPKPEYVKGHICGEEKVVRTGPGDWYPKASTGTVGGNFNFAIIQKWTNRDGETWYQIYLNDDETGPFDLNTGWIEGLEDVCEGIYVPVFDSACSGELAWPYQQKWTITSGWRTAARPTHSAIDIGAPMGTPVIAAGDGYISFAGSDKYGGLYVDVVHPELGVKTRYLHLSYIERFSGKVETGQQIGLTGSTGLSTGPHLHFAVFDLQTGKDINPMSFLDGSSAGACEFAGQGSKDQEVLKPTFLQKVSEQEEKWDGDFEVMDDWRGDPHLWSENCKVWIKDYRNIWADGYDVRDEWTGGESGGALIFNPNKVYLVANGIWLEYIEEGGPCGVLGLPSDRDGYTTETPAGISGESSSRGVTDGAVQRFENGSIYWHWNSNQNQSHTYAVYGEISDIYEQRGGTWSYHGFPISDIYAIDGVQCQNFEVENICLKNSINFERYDKTIRYMHDEMTENLESSTASGIKFHLQCDENPFSNLGCLIGFGAGDDHYTKALVSWGLKVCPNCDWDHKPKLDDKLGLEDDNDYYFPIRGDAVNEYFYDIWSNIHYGYVGRGVGFDGDTLQSGAAFADGIAGRNDEADVLSVKIGIELWDEHGENLTEEHIRLKILSYTWKYDELASQDKGTAIIRSVNGK